MFIFYILLLIILLCSPTVSKIQENNISLKKEQYFLNLYLVCITSLAIVFVSGFRSSFIDTKTYRFMYEQTGTNFTYALEQTDKGFFLFMVLINHISSNSQLMIFISAVIVTFFVIKTIYNYSPDFRLSVYLYTTSGLFAVSMNGLRQFIVASAIFAAIPLILNNKKWLFFLLVLLASTIHSSAVIFLIIYFLVKTRVFSFKVILSISGACITLIFAERLFPVLFNFLEGTNFSLYEDVVLTDSGGTSFVRVLVEAAPLILAYILYKTSNKDTFINNKLLVILTNLASYNVVFYIFAMQNWIFARVSVYFSIFTLLLIPILIHEFFDRKSRILIKYIIYILYFIYFYYQMRYAYGITNFPFNFNLF